MAERQVKALVDTILKRSTSDSIGLPDAEKISLAQGQTLDINWYRSTTDHWELELQSPQKGFYNWFAYVPHVEIEGDIGFKGKLRDLAAREWRFFGNGHKKESEEGCWQRISQYWREGVGINYIDTPTEVSSNSFPWSAVFISWIMRQAGAGNNFNYSARHADYIKESIQRRKSNDTTATFVGYRTTELAPQVGDLVCASRAGANVDYDTTTDYPSHCDLVVATRSGEVDVIGGNVSNSVTKQTLKTDATGKINDSSRPWFVVIKNQL